MPFNPTDDLETTVNVWPQNPLKEHPTSDQRRVNTMPTITHARPAHVSTKFMTHVDVKHRARLSTIGANEMEARAVGVGPRGRVGREQVTLEGFGPSRLIGSPLIQLRHCELHATHPTV